MIDLVWIVMILLVLAQPVLAKETINIFISDFGIEQYDLTSPNWVYPEIPIENRLIIRMPRPWNGIDKEAWSKKTSRELLQNVCQGVLSGSKNYEIQIIQDIGVAGYFSGEIRPELQGRQMMCAEFGQYAYGAIHSSLKSLRDCYEVRTTAVVGSNGGAVFARSGADFVNFVVFVNSRSARLDTAEAIKGIGPQNCVIIVNREDFLAFNDLAARMDTALELKNRFPQIDLILVQKPDRNWAKALNPIQARVRAYEVHIAVMKNRSLEWDVIRPVKKDGKYEWTALQLHFSELSRSDRITKGYSFLPKIADGKLSGQCVPSGCDEDCDAAWRKCQGNLPNPSEKCLEQRERCEERAAN